MKLHNVLVVAVIDSLHQIFVEKKYADKVIEKVLRSNPKWGARDRGFIAENVYEIVRNWRLLNEIADVQSEISTSSLWKIVGTWLTINEIQLPEWKEFEGINKYTLYKRYQEVTQNKAIKESFPEWLHTLCLEELGDIWLKEMAALNSPAQVIIRCNTLKTTPKKMLDALTKENIEVSPIPNYKNAFIVNKRQNIFKTKAFLQGLFEVQDASSQLVSEYLDVEPTMRIVDACAGAGGKSLHLAALMQNKGQILSLDVEKWKLDELRKRATRCDAQNIETRIIENNKTIKRIYNTADRLLLDVPCTGLGVVRRNPDTKWKISPETLAHTQTLQAQILEEYAPICKKGGILVYATCSILPSENTKQIEKFIQKHGAEYEWIEERKLWAHQSGFDGFYMAKIKRK